MPTPGLTVVASPQGLVTDDPAGVRHDPTIDAVADTFAPVVYDLSVTPTPCVVPAGRRLELRVAVRNASTNDALIGYDATGYPSELVITPPPAAAAAAPVVANVAGSTPAGSSPMAPVLVLVLAVLGGIVVVGRRPRSDVTPVIG